MAGQVPKFRKVKSVSRWYDWRYRLHAGRREVARPGGITAPIGAVTRAGTITARLCCPPTVPRSLLTWTSAPAG
jgi:hypothetical protein